MNGFDLVLSVHVAATWIMVGVIWFVQLVHYPLFHYVEREAFRAFAADHQKRTTWIVLPTMLSELCTGVILCLVPWPTWPPWAPWFGLGLIGALWASTFFLQVPLHTRLSDQGYDPEVHARLVSSNWLRTFGWSFRGVLVFALAWQT